MFECCYVVMSHSLTSFRTLQLSLNVSTGNQMKRTVTFDKIADFSVGLNVVGNWQVWYSTQLKKVLDKCLIVLKDLSAEMPHIISLSIKMLFKTKKTGFYLFIALPESHSRRLKMSSWKMQLYTFSIQVHIFEIGTRKRRIRWIVNVYGRCGIV